ncbi:MAG: Na/Pi cotransporter family protein [Magnetospiraceae bacterium]
MDSHLVSVLAGLGFFFFGMHLSVENLKALAGRRLRATIYRWTKNPFAALAWGMGAGAIAQSSTIATFVLAGMVGSGLITVAASLPIVLGANIGVTMLAFIATLKMASLPYLLAGASGLAISSKYMAKYRVAVSALFAVSLILLGIVFIRDGAAPLVNMPWFMDLVHENEPMFLVFVVAMVAALLTQSSSATVVLVITLTSAGAMTMMQSVMGIYGAMLGAGLNRFFLALRLEGRARQVAYFEVMTRVAGCLLFVPLLYVEDLTSLPLVVSFAKAITIEMEQAAAVIFLLFNVVIAAIFLLLIVPSSKFLEKLSPASPAEDDAKPKFISHHALAEPETGIELAIHEIQRLTSLYTLHVAPLREDRPKAQVLQDLVARQKSATDLSFEITNFLAELGSHPLGSETYERLNLVININRLNESMIRSLGELTLGLLDAQGNKNLNAIHLSFMEGLDFVLLMLPDTLGDEGGMDRAMLMQMTQDKGAIMEKVRRSYLTAETGLSAEERMNFLIVTNLFERVMWLVRSVVDYSARLAGEELMPDSPANSQAADLAEERLH